MADKESFSLMRTPANQDYRISDGSTLKLRDGSTVPQADDSTTPAVCLALESRDPFRILNESVGQHLHGNATAKPGVAREVDRPHTVCAEQTFKYCRIPAGGARRPAGRRAPPPLISRCLLVRGSSALRA